MNRKIRAAVLTLALLSLLTACGKKDAEAEVEDTPTLPEEYSYNESVVVTALSTTEENVHFSEGTAITYNYDGLTDSGSAIESYVSTLKRSGYYVVDKELAEIEEEEYPDFTAAEGTVRMAKDYVPETENSEGSQEEEQEEAQEEEKKEDSGDESEGEGEEEPGPQVITLVLNWEAGECSVTIDLDEGSVTPLPPPPPSPQPRPMTLSQAVEYVGSLSPSVLGLSGTSMESYNIYAADGSVLVDNQPCLRLKVYGHENPDAGNEFAGTYLLSSDGLHLYRLNESAGTVQELDLPDI